MLTTENVAVYIFEVRINKSTYEQQVKCGGFASQDRVMSSAAPFHNPLTFNFLLLAHHVTITLFLYINVLFSFFNALL